MSNVIIPSDDNLLCLSSESALDREIGRVKSLGGTVEIDGDDVVIKSDVILESTKRKLEERIKKALAKEA